MGGGLATELTVTARRRVQAMADAVFGSRHEASLWLRESNGALAGQPPLALLDKEEGVRLVEAVLGRIAHGIVE